MKNQEITFEPLKHKYFNKYGEELISVSTLVHLYSNPFDPDGTILKRCAEKRNKTEKELRDEWQLENKKACDKGNIIHSELEHWIKTKCIKDTDNKDLIEQISKISFKGNLISERIVFNNKLKLAGMIDLTDDFKTKKDLYDLKTNKQLKDKSFWTREEGYKMMLFPVEHLMDCNWVHYCLQLSFYQLIEETNGTKINNRELIYINPKSRRIERYDVPYLKDEVLAIIEHYKQTQSF